MPYPGRPGRGQRAHYGAVACSDRHEEGLVQALTYPFPSPSRATHTNRKPLFSVYAENWPRQTYESVPAGKTDKWSSFSWLL